MGFAQGVLRGGIAQFGGATHVFQAVAFVCTAGAAREQHDAKIAHGVAVALFRSDMQQANRQARGELVATTCALKGDQATRAIVQAAACPFIPQHIWIRHGGIDGHSQYLLGASVEWRPSLLLPVGNAKFFLLFVFSVVTGTLVCVSGLT